MADRPISLAHVSARVKLHKPTVHRLLQSLGQHGLIIQDPESKAYRPGLKLFELSNAVLRNMELRTQALPELAELNQLVVVVLRVRLHRARPELVGQERDPVAGLS